MNRKQKKAKRLKATLHKDKCKWLKGGNPRRFRYGTQRLWYKLRLSRKRRIELSNKSFTAVSSLDVSEIVEL